MSQSQTLQGDGGRLREHETGVLESTWIFELARTVAFCMAAVIVLSLAAFSIVGYLQSHGRDDRSQELERAVRSELGTACADVSVQRVPSDSETSFPVPESWRALEYKGWYRLKGAHVRTPFTVLDLPDQIEGHRDSLRAEIRDAGGLERLRQLALTFGSEFPDATEFTSTPYQWTFTGYECSNPQHAKTPRVVRNRFGEFNPRDVMFGYEGSFVDSYDPAGVFSYDSTASAWIRLPDEAREVFESTRIHRGCDMAENHAYLDGEPTSTVTTIAGY